MYCHGSITWKRATSEDEVRRVKTRFNRGSSEDIYTGEIAKDGIRIRLDPVHDMIIASLGGQWYYTTNLWLRDSLKKATV